MCFNSFFYPAIVSTVACSVVLSLNPAYAKPVKPIQQITVARDDELGVKNGLKAISRDGGLTWSPLYGSGAWTYKGRPDVRLLSSGEVLLTSRVGRSQKGQPLGAYLETQKMALLPTPLDGSVRPGSFSALIDKDNHPTFPDWGYSGWVELPDGTTYVVQYITADAPAGKPFIHGYSRNIVIAAQAGILQRPADTITHPALNDSSSLVRSFVSTEKECADAHQLP